MGRVPRIDPALFSARFPSCCRLEHCNGRCCLHGGAWVDAAEKDLILACRDRILPFMAEDGPAPEAWFGDSIRDGDFPSGTAFETAQHNGACIFLRPGQFCALQQAAAAEGLHPWAWKPHFCILFPLVVQEGVLKADEHLTDLWCMQTENRTDPIVRSVERELTYLYGAGLVHRLKKRACSLP